MHASERGSDFSNHVLLACKRSSPDKYYQVSMHYAPGMDFPPPLRRAKNTGPSFSGQLPLRLGVGVVQLVSDIPLQGWLTTKKLPSSRLFETMPTELLIEVRWTPPIPLLVLRPQTSCQIMLHLQPADLLSLSLTNKCLRSILLHETSRHIWTLSLSCVQDLPPCPIDMMQLQYANLVFGQNCQVR